MISLSENNIVNLNTGNFSLWKMILWYLHQRNLKYGIFDKIDTEIYYKSMLKCNDYLNLSYYNILWLQSISWCK